MARLHQAQEDGQTLKERRRLRGQFAAALGPLAASPGIDRTPGVVGGAACIGGTRIPVWVLESYRRSGASDAELRRNFPSLTAAALVSAWLYVEMHADEIDEEIQRNDPLQGEDRRHRGG